MHIRRTLCKFNPTTFVFRENLPKYEVKLFLQSSFGRILNSSGNMSFGGFVDTQFVK